jgi:hypothetical protein
MDKINDKYGEFVITPALMMGIADTIIDRIAFGASRNWKNCINSNADRAKFPLDFRNTLLYCCFIVLIGA